MNKLNYLDPNNPNTPTSIRIYLQAKEIFPYFGFAFMGLILFSVTYSILFYYKDILIAYARRNEKNQRGFYYTYIEHKPYIRYVIYFNLIIMIFWLVSFFLIWRDYMYKFGFGLFIFFYALFYFKYYVVDENKFDHFEETKWFYFYVKENFFKKEEKLKKE